MSPATIIMNEGAPMESVVSPQRGRSYLANEVYSIGLYMHTEVYSIGLYMHTEDMIVLHSARGV